MNLDQTPSFPTLSGEVFDSLPESIRSYIREQEKEDWAMRMKDLLIFAKNEVERHLELGALPQESLLRIEETYGQIIAEGFEYHWLLPPLPKGKRGRQKQRDGKNLLDRLKEKRSCVLRFMYDCRSVSRIILENRIFAW